MRSILQAPSIFSQSYSHSEHDPWEGQEKLMIPMALEIILGRASTNPSFIHKHFEVLSPPSLPPPPLGDLTCVDLPLTPLSKLALGINIPPPCYVSRARSGEHHGLSILAESSSEHKDERERCSIARKNTFDYCPRPSYRTEWGH